MTTQCNKKRKLAILVSGGPAPGINGVIAAATIVASRRAWEVIGVLDGWKWLIKGDLKNHFLTLCSQDMSRMHLTGGSILRTARANPTKQMQDLEQVVKSLRDLQVTDLLTIGGDDTCLAASCVARLAPDIRVAHVPKTIDNDLPLPEGIDTFGFQTARSVGSNIVTNLMEDAEATSRWCLVVAMGRHAGHLALGIGKATGAALTIIPEEFKNKQISLRHIIDIIFTSVVKRHIAGHNHGVAIIAEGVTERLSQCDLKRTGVPVSDEFGNLRLDNLDLAGTLKYELGRRAQHAGLSIKFIAKNIGYELRCAPPIAYDCEYTRDLGHAAVRLLDGADTIKSPQKGAIVCIQSGKLTPIPFTKIYGAKGQRIAVRFVSIDTESYIAARSYMTRLESSDLEDEIVLGRLARESKMSPLEFKKRFGYIIN